MSYRDGIKHNKAILGASIEVNDILIFFIQIVTSCSEAAREHRVPLCKRATEILNAARRLGGGTFVFPCRDGKPKSEIRLPKLLQVHKITAVQHAFCSSFRNWASVRTNKPGGHRGRASAVDSRDAAQALGDNNVLGQTVESFLDFGNGGRDGTFTGNWKPTG